MKSSAPENKNNFKGEFKGIRFNQIMIEIHWIQNAVVIALPNIKNVY